MNKQTLIDHLNEDLAGELSAIVQYITYAAKATGPYRPQLAAFFLEEVADEQLHAQFLANKIVALGGEPVTVPAPVPPAATNKEMVDQVLKAYAYDVSKQLSAKITPNGLKKRMPMATKDWSSLWKILSGMRWAIRKRRSGCCAIGRCSVDGKQINADLK